MLRKFCLFLFAWLAMTVLPVPVYAVSDLTVSCNGSGCTPSSAPAFFSSSTSWYPGLSVTKTMTVTNASTFSQDIGTLSVNSSSTGGVDSVMNMVIKRVSTNATMWSGTLSTFYAVTTEIPLATLATGISEDFSYTITMQSTAGNAYQNKQTGFDLVVGFIAPTITPTPTLTPTPTSGGGGGGGGGSSSSGGGGGGGSVQGAQAPVCTDSVPGSAPTVTGVSTGTNSVTLTWSQAASPVSYYLIAYGRSSGQYAYGNPNVGGSGTTSYTITNLSGGTTYYFVVRAGNGCKPGSFSSEVSASPGGGEVAGIAPGFAAGVLGVATESAAPSQSATTSGEIEGVTTTAPATCSGCPWILYLVFMVIFTVLYLFWLVPQMSIAHPIRMGVAIPIVMYGLFVMLNRSCVVNGVIVDGGSIFCRFFLPIEAIVFSLVGSFWKWWMNRGKPPVEPPTIGQS